jgi:hypothetical protein
LCIDSFGPTQAAQAGFRQLTITGTGASDVAGPLSQTLTLDAKHRSRTSRKPGNQGYAASGADALQRIKEKSQGWLIDQK